MKTEPLLLRILTVTVVFAAAVAIQTAARADALSNWTYSQVVTNPLGNEGFNSGSIAYGQGRYVAVGSYVFDDNGIIQTSEDGVTWTNRTTLDYSVLQLRDVTFAQGVFVAVGWDYFGGHNIYRSTNGINWTEHTTAMVNVYAVASSGTLFAAVGDGLLLGGSGTTNRNIYTSSDGITWTARNSGAPANDVQPILTIAYGAGRFVAIDLAGYFYTSTSGVIWTRSGTGPFAGVLSFCNDRFISKVNGTNLVSLDGLAWSPMVKNTTNVFIRVTYGHGAYVAVSDRLIFTSNDSTNWTQANVPSASEEILTDVAFGKHNVVAVGVNPSFPRRPVGYVSDSLLELGIDSALPPQLRLSGVVGGSYRFEFLTNLCSTNWQALTNFPLTTSPYTWTDTEATNALRAYRAVLLP